LIVIVFTGEENLTDPDRRKTGWLGNI